MKTPLMLEKIQLKRNFKGNREIFLLGTFAFVFIFDLFLFPRISDFLIAFLIIFWLLIIRIFKFDFWITLTLAAFCYLVSFTVQFLEGGIVLEKGAFWFLILFIIGLSQKFMEESFKKK